MFVDAKSPGVAAFYRKFGFIPLEDNPLSLMLPLQTILAVIPEDKTGQGIERRRPRSDGGLR
jgi:hypothetical protein